MATLHLTVHDRLSLSEAGAYELARLAGRLASPGVLCAGFLCDCLLGTQLRLSLRLVWQALY